MKKKRFVFVRIGSSALVAECTAVFYPYGYDPSAHTPSFALSEEPREIGIVPSAWQLFPAFYTKGKKSRFVIPVEKGTSIYGMGEVTGKLERRGTKVVLWNTDNWGYKKHKGQRLYQSHPWVLGVRKDGTAFGVLADTTWPSECKIKKSGEVVFTSKASGFRVFVIDHESPQGVMKSLGALTGTIDMPPMWALGYQQCRWSYYPDQRVREIADSFRSRQIPCDVIWMDIHYMDGYRVFTFDPEHFPDPKQTNEYLHENGFKAVWMIDPGVKADPDYAVYKSGSQQDVWVKNKKGKIYHGDVWPGACVFPDFTKPDVQTWWANLYAEFMSHGIDGVWNDMNEPAVMKSPKGTMPSDNQHAGGDGICAGPHARYHNVYGMLMVKATRAGVMKSNPDKRPFVLTRSNYLGGQRYAATWTGDNVSSWDHLKMSIPMSLTLGLSGQPFNGPDIGGFMGKASADLWGHWISLGAFYPFSRAHAAQGTPDKEPWAFGQEVEDCARVAISRRYRLLPYFYTLFQEAVDKGLPVMRPVFFADPGNAALREENTIFLLGNDLLIIPKWTSNPRIPHGFRAVISLLGEDSTQDRFQCDVRIRDGAIVPLTNVIQTTRDFDHCNLSLIIRLTDTGEASGKVYEDANDGYGYMDGEYRETTYFVKKQDQRLMIKRDVDGNYQVPERMLRIILVTDEGQQEFTVCESDEMIIDCNV